MSAANDVHCAYVNAVDGGWHGYQGACEDCNWRGPVREKKDDARLDASAHVERLVQSAAEKTEQGKVARYRDAITAALEVLGTGDCREPDCEGCRYEREEARRVLAVVLVETSSPSTPLEQEESRNVPRDR